MAAPLLNHRHIFGLKADVKNNIHFLEEGVILYPVGHTVVIHNLDTKQQRFISGSHGGTTAGGKPPEITAIAVSPNKRYVAIGEKGTERAVCSIYDLRTLRRKKVLMNNDTQYHAREYVSLAFGPDNRTLLTQGGAPHWPLSNWSWAKEKELAKMSIQTKNTVIYQCSFCPADPTLICVTGKTLLLYFRLNTTPNECKFQAIEPNLFEHPPEDFVAHAWGDQKQCIIGSREGGLLYMENTMFRAKLPPLPLNGRGISCMTSFANGFVLGCDEGTVLIYEKDEKEYYKLSRQLNIDTLQNSNLPSGKIKNIAISPNNEYMVLTLSNAQMYMVKLYDGDVLCSEDAKFDCIGQNHTGPITGLDTCVRKPLIITCGVDKSVRIWNYLSKSLELCVIFADAPRSVAFHPSGLYCLIGFPDKLRLCTILMSDIRLIKELPYKNCIECQFSNGGHLFAAVNVGMINVFNFFTCELVGTFRGHSAQIRSVFWSLDDTALVSSSEVGEIYERRHKQTTRSQEYIQKGCKFTSILSTEDSKIYAVGDDSTLKEIIDGSLNKTVDTGTTLTQLVVSAPPHRMMFASTVTGVIRSYKFPLTGDKKDYQAHCREVSRLRIAPDDSCLFSVGLDGTLAVFDIQEKDGRIPKRERPDAVPFSEEVLVTKTDLEEKTQMMNELKGKVAELTNSNEYQLKANDMNYQDRLKSLTEKYTIQIEHDKLKIETLRDEKEELQLEFDEKVNQVKNHHAKELNIADIAHQRKHMEKVNEYTKLQDMLEVEERNNVTQMRQLEMKHREDLAALREKEEKRLEEEAIEYAAVLKQKEEWEKKKNETEDQMLHDADKEVEKLKENYQAKQNAEHETTLRLKGENGIMKKRQKGVKKKIEDQQERIKSYQDKETHRRQQIKMLGDKKRDLKSEREIHDKTISQKETEINDLKKDNQELEKYKFVLDFQIKELKSEIEPRQETITKMRKKVTKMDVDLEASHRSKVELKRQETQLKATIQLKQQQIKEERRDYRKSLSALTQMKNDLYQSVQNIQNPQQLRADMDKMYRAHVKEVIQSVEVDPDVNKEYKRQKQHLEQTVAGLKTKMSRDVRSRKNDNMRIMQENVALIKEINTMRRDLKFMHQVQRQKELNTASEGERAVQTVDPNWDEREAQRTLDMQRMNIEQLRREIEMWQQRVVNDRPISREQRQGGETYAMRTGAY